MLSLMCGTTLPRKKECNGQWACQLLGATKRTLHFDRWLHFARELCLANKMEIFLVGTDIMMADGFTKPVDKTKFLKCRDYILTQA